MNLVVIIDTGFIGAEHVVNVHVPDESWNKMTGAQRDAYMEGGIRDAIDERVTGEWRPASEYYSRA